MESYDFVDYSKNIGIKIEFPIDYFAKKKINHLSIFKLLKRNDIYPIIALENTQLNL